jgi:hypothetical protein
MSEIQPYCRSILQKLNEINVLFFGTLGAISLQ